MCFHRLAPALLALTSIACQAAPAGSAPEPAAGALGLGKFRPQMTREEARVAGQINCRPEMRNRDGKPAQVWCDIPADQAKLGTLKVLAAMLHYETVGFDRVTSISLRVAGHAGPAATEVQRVQGVKLMPRKRSYIGSVGGVQVKVSDAVDDPEAFITWTAEAQADPKQGAKQAAQATADKALLKGF